MEFQGRINKLLPIQTGTNKSGNEWQRQDFIFEYFENDTDRWSDRVLLSIMNDRIAEYNLHEGDEVIIGFSHNVRQYQDKWFNELRVYKCEKVASAPHLDEPEPQTEQTQQAEKELPLPPAQDEDDDLPF